MKRLYDGGILIFVGIILIAVGIAAAGTGIKRVNKFNEKSTKEQSKPIVIPLPERKYEPTYDVPVPPAKDTPKAAEEDIPVISPQDIVPKEMITSQEEKPWYWPF